MKLKNIKLLKTLAVTGALGLVAAVPVITATACSSDTSNSGGSSGDNTGGDSSGGGTGGSTGGTSGGGSSSDTSSKITPVLNDKITINGGALSGIYDGNTNDSNELIAKVIKENPSLAFKNSKDLDVQNLDITVDAGDFLSTSQWTGKDYKSESDNWSTGSTAVLYSRKSTQIDIKSLDDLKTTQLTSEKLKDILKDAGVSTDDKTTYTVENKIGLTNEDLIHVNVVATPNASEAKVANATSYDLQIPTSDINLDLSSCKVTVAGNDKVNEMTDTTYFVYNIGIDSKTHYSQSTESSIKKGSESSWGEVLTKLGMASYGSATDGNWGNSGYVLKNDTIATQLGVFNCEFSNPSVTVKTASSVSLTEADEANTEILTITFKAKPTNDSYYWDDGSTGEKTISFDAKFTLTAE